MSFKHAIRIMGRELYRAKQELLRVQALSDTEAAALQKRIDEMQIETTQLEMLSETFRTSTITSR